jgi:hypothetical protein
MKRTMPHPRAVRQRPAAGCRDSAGLPACAGEKARLEPCRDPVGRGVLSGDPMIRRLPDGRYRLYSLRVDPRTGRKRNLGTFRTRAEAEAHERAVQFFKHRVNRGTRPRRPGA